MAAGDDPVALRAEIERLEAALRSSKEATAEAAAARARLEGIFEAAVDGIVTIDETGTIESVNAATTRIFGYAAEELVGHNVKKLMPRPVRDEHDAHLERYRRTGERHIIGIGREVTGRRADGSEFPLELSVAEVRDGSRRLFTGTIKDTTERRAAEKEIRESYERLRAILDSAVDGIIAIDETGTIREVNPAVEAIFGYRPDELVGEDVRILMPPPFDREHDGYVRRYLETGEARIIGSGREVLGRRKDGSTFPHYLAVSEGFVRHERVFTGIVSDLGRLRDAEERARQAEQLAALSTITAGIAHDVGTPMTTILGYAELMQSSLTDEKNRERAGHIVDQVRRVTDLLRTLLNIARPRRVEPEPVVIRDILDHSLEFFREKLRGRGIVIERDYAIVPPVLGDRDRLEQVFLNLIVNAADAMPQGGTLTVRLAPAGDGLIEIRVSDTGIGIAPDVLGRIFEPFYTTKERGKGTGLGLLVGKRIIQDHGGRIAVESELDVGTTFRIALPTSESRAGRPARRPAGGT